MASKDPVGRSCGYGLVYELAKDKKVKRLTDEVLSGCVEKIGKTIAKEENRVRVGMGGALMSIGKRNTKLNAALQSSSQKQSARSTSATGTRSASR